METKFNPELNISHDQRAQLSHTVATPGFQIVNTIMRTQLDRMIVDFINVPEADDAAVLAKHKIMKAAAQFYELVTNRINAEVQQFMHEAGASTAAPIDPTEGLIDLGDHAVMDAAPDLLDGFELNEQLVEEELNSE